MEYDKSRPGNYLSLDGGNNGLDALTALITLEEITKRLQRDLNLSEAPLPCEVFDVIIASGHATIAALMVGKMRLTPSQATNSYKKLEPALSVGPTEDKDERERNMDAFKKAFIQVLEDHGLKEDTPMLSKEQNERDAKIVICAQTALNPPSLYPIHSYPVRSARTAPCTILGAACAGIASPDTFPSVTIGSGHKKIALINAVPNYVNLTKVLLHEAHRIVGSEGNVATIVSIGSGRRVAPNGLESTHENLVAGTMDSLTSRCEKAHQDVPTLLQKLIVYVRFNHDEIPGDMADVSSINARLSAYFQQGETSKHLNDAVESMRARQNGVNLMDIHMVDRNEVRLKPRPSVVPNFVGREDIVEAMRQRHFGERSNNTHMPAITVLSGLGGSGKTQIALKFADELEEKCRDVPVYFLNASSEQNLKADFETIIRSQGVMYRSQSCEVALAWLAAKERKWCLILDNVDDPSLNLFPYIPKSAHGNVIVTTRNSSNTLLSPDNHHAVDELPMAEAVTLVLKMAQYESTAENQLLAQAIVKELGGLPLALAHAGGYIFVHQCLTAYPEIYRTSRAQFLDSNQALPQDYQLSVATTVQMSMNKLPQVAKDMLVIFSHLEASLTPLQIISKAAERHFRMIDGQTKDETVDPQTIQHAEVLMTIFCPDGEWFEWDFNTSIQNCLEYSLLQITTQDDDTFFSMHILLQAYLQSTSTTIREHQPEQLIVRLLGSSITIDNNYTYQTFNRLLVPHLRLIAADHVVEAGDHFGFGQVLREQGSAKLSTEHYERCLAWRRNNLGDENMGTVKAMHQLVGCHNDVGRYQEALELGIKVLDLLKRVSGDEHPETLQAMNNLAASYSQLGRYQEALELQLKVAYLVMRVLGDEDPNTLVGMNKITASYSYIDAISNAAVSYSHLGRHPEALGLQVKVLDLWKRVLGDEHPRTLIAMGNTAMSYSRLGRYQEALELQVKVLDLRKRVSGDEHRSTLVAMNNIAASYSLLGRHPEALELQMKVLDLRTRVSGDDHLDTLHATGNLATTYSHLGRHQEALGLRVKVFDLQKRISGDEHPDSLLAMGNLAMSYSYLGRYQEALKLQVKVLDLRKRVSGDEHPETLLAMGNLAMTYSHLERYPEALELQVKVLDLRKRVSGDEHPETLRAMGNLAMTYSSLGRYPEALKLQVKVLDLRKRASGDEHPETLVAMANLAMTYSHLGRYPEALELQVKVLDLRKRVSGDKHPETLRAMDNLVMTYRRLGRHQEALRLQVKILDLRKWVSGDEHPETLVAMSILAMTYSNLRRHPEALELHVKVLDLRKRVSGDEHPETLRAMSNLAMTYRHLGRRQEALGLSVKVSNLQKRVSGDEHPNRSDRPCIVM